MKVPLRDSEIRGSGETFPVQEKCTIEKDRSRGGRAPGQHAANQMADSDKGPSLPVAAGAVDGGGFTTGGVRQLHLSQDTKRPLYCNPPLAHALLKAVECLRRRQGLRRLPRELL